jgi:hypothetical protein
MSLLMSLLPASGELPCETPAFISLRFEYLQNIYLYFIFGGVVTRQNLHRNKYIVQESELPNYVIQLSYDFHCQVQCIIILRILLKRYLPQLPILASKADVVSRIRLCFSKDLNREREDQGH